MCVYVCGCGIVSEWMGECVCVGVVTGACGGVMEVVGM